MTITDILSLVVGIGLGFAYGRHLVLRHYGPTTVVPLALIVGGMLATLLVIAGQYILGRRRAMPTKWEMLALTPLLVLMPAYWPQRALAWMAGVRGDEPTVLIIDPGNVGIAVGVILGAFSMWPIFGMWKRGQRPVRWTDGLGLATCLSCTSYYFYAFIEMVMLGEL